MIGVEPSSVTPWVAGASATTLLTVAIALIFRQIASLVRENKRCNRRLGILFRLAVDNKLSIPPDYWDEVHEAAKEPLVDIPLPRRRRPRDPDD